MRDRDRSSVAWLLSRIHRESDGSVHGRRCEDAGRPVSGSGRGGRPRIRMVLSDPDKVLVKDTVGSSRASGAECHDAERITAWNRRDRT